MSKKPTKEHQNARVCTDFNHCAAFLQNEHEILPVYKEATKETENQVLMFNGKVANTVFHAMSSGKTENAKDVWGGAVPYLVSVECESDKKRENFETISEFTWEQVFSLLNVSERSVSDIEKTDAGGTKSAKIGGKVFSGSEIRSAFSLRSSAFDAKATDSGIEFTVHGYGHGVGMSQYGADFFARSGMNYKEILAHFYKGTELISIDFGA